MHDASFNELLETIKTVVFRKNGNNCFHCNWL